MKPRLFFLPLLAAIALFPGCAKKTVIKHQEREIRVTLGKLEQRQFRRQLPVQGTVTPVEYATLSAKVSGTLEGLKADEGARLKKGDVLFHIDRKNLENLVLVMESNIQVRQAALASANIAVETAKIQRELAQNDFERATRLRKSNVISQASYENDETTFKKTEEDVHAAEASVLHAKAELKAAENNLAIARKNLADSIICAPFDCVVTEKFREENEYVTPGKEILRIENHSSLEVICYISAIYYNQIEVGKTPAEFFLGDRLQGKSTVTYKAPSIDPESRTFKLKILVSPESRLVSGMLCNVNLILEEKTAWGLPADALLLRANDRYIAYTRGADNRAASVEMKRGITDGQYCEVLNPDGLFETQFIVTGQTFVNNGSLLKIMTPAQR